jgi:hypothetical protein
MILEAPNRLESYDDLGITFFLAGTIDNGESLDWQKEISDYADEINVTVVDPAKKVIIRIFNWNVESNREAEHTIYHGDRYDVFVWNCVTRTSGILEYDDVLTDEYHYKCSE